MRPDSYKPDICIYHGPGCADGFTAAWAIQTRWPDLIFIPAQYGAELPPEEIVSGKAILIVDFSYDIAGLEGLFDRGVKSITILDHHKTAEETLAEMPRELKPLNIRAGEDPAVQVVFDMEKSGARLAWEYAWSEGREPPALIRLVEDRDLWRFSYPETRAVHAVLMSEEPTFERWTRLSRDLEGHKRHELTLVGEALIKDQTTRIHDILRQSTRYGVIDGHTVRIANVPYAYASEAGNLLGKGELFAATYFDGADGRRHWSLRSDPGGLDVGEIARKHGGGGHVHAAGFTTLLSFTAEPDEEPAPQLNEIPTAPGQGRITTQETTAQ